jgi:hypothetical protein
MTGNAANAGSLPLRIDLSDSSAPPDQQPLAKFPTSDLNSGMSPRDVASGGVASGPRWLVLIAGAIILFPALLTLGYVIHFGVNVPFADDWALVPYLTLARDHQLTVTALFAQHNEERILFPRLAMLAIATATGWNVTGEMLAYVLCLALICLLFFSVYVREVGITPRSLLLVAPVSFLVFSLRQSENLLWGWEVVWGVLALFAVLALYLLQIHGRPWLAFVLAAFSGIVASYSGLIGLLIWPVGALEILLVSRVGSQSARWRWLSLALWLAVGAIAAVSYVRGYVKPAQTPNPLAPLDDPLGAFVFYLSLLGAAFAPAMPGATVIGLLFVCAFVYALVRQVRYPERRIGSFLLAVVLSWFSADAVITFGRMGFGPDQALVSRYTIFGLIGSAALYLWLVLAWNLHRREFFAGIRVENVLILSIAALIAAGVVSGIALGITGGVTTLSEREHLVDIARNYRRKPDSELARLYSAPDYDRVQLEYLERERLSVFAKGR